MGGGKNPRRRWGLRVAAFAVVAGTIGAAAWFHWVYSRIEWYAHHDEAAPADAICVLGAAEYDGHPSPVFRARLDHAVELYRQGIAPIVIPIGGAGGDQYSEGAVGKTYLESRGVPEQNIIAETHSTNTEQSARRLAVIARANGFRRLVVVSDGTHLFRIHALCAANGLDVLTSPRERGSVEDSSLEAQRIVHEMLSYTLWRLHLH
ncbi:MAG: YdcF family protein [Acidobacteriota bacterium]